MERGEKKQYFLLRCRRDSTFQRIDIDKSKHFSLDVCEWAEFSTMGQQRTKSVLRFPFFFFFYHTLIGRVNHMWKSCGQKANEKKQSTRSANLDRAQTSHIIKLVWHYFVHIIHDTHFFFALRARGSYVSTMFGFHFSLGEIVKIVNRVENSSIK